MLIPKNIVIVGGNAAGPAAAAKAKRTAPDSNVILFEAGDYISTGTCELPYLLSGEIEKFEDIVFFNPESFEKEKGVKVFTKHFVEKIDRRNKSLTIRNLISSHVFTQNYDRLILTTGSKSKSIPSIPLETKNVFNFKKINDILAIKNYLKNNFVRSVLIVGAGYIGLEAADAFKKMGYDVILIDKEKYPMSESEAEIQNLISEILIKNKIEFYGSCDNVKYIFNQTKIKSVNISGRIIDVDIVVNASGFEPNTDLALGSQINIGSFGGIKTDQRLKTNDPNIFAAGDNTEVIEKITNRPIYFPQATAAHLQGHISGENAAGGNSFFYPIVKNTGVKFFDKYLTQVGITSSYAQLNRINYFSVSAVVPNLVKVMPQSENVFGKILIEKFSKRIIGASFLGGREVAGFADIISTYIENKIPADKLAETKYNYTPPLSPFINLLSVLGRKIEKEIK